MSAVPPTTPSALDAPASPFPGATTVEPLSVTTLADLQPDAAPETSGEPLPGHQPPETPRQHRARRRRRLTEWVLVVVAAVLIAAGLRAFFVQAFYVPSGSMEPTLLVGDRILVVKVGYTIHRGDIIVFTRPPRDTTDPQIHDLVKRVIGLPGDTIWSAHGVVYLDGKVLSEPWLPRPDPLGQTGISRQTIGPNQYFVMGDNRASSYDSRYWGTVPGSLVVGKVILIVWRDGHPYLHYF